jgi:hypothetical protein
VAAEASDVSINSTDGVADSPDLAAWEQELDRLEADVSAGERLLDQRLPQEVALWTPPVDLGPFPAELAERAVALLDRMIQLQQDVPEAMDQIRRQLGATRRVAEATGSARRTSLYIDTSA